MTDAIKNAGKSWKTTVGGVAGFLALAAGAVQAHFDGDPETVAQWGPVIAAIPVVIALFFARDNDVSSESAGAK